MVGSKHHKVTYTGHIDQFTAIISDGLTFRQNRQFTDSLVLTNGDLSPSYNTRKNLLIGRGTLSFPDIKNHVNCSTSLIIWDGDIENIAPNACAIHCTGKIACSNSHTNEYYLKFSTIHENCKELPFGIKFYYPKEHGLTVADDGKKVTVERLEAGSHFGKTDLKIGDQLIEINGEKITSKYTLYRMLVRAMVNDGKTELKILRDQKPMTIQFAMPIAKAKEN